MTMINTQSGHLNLQCLIVTTLFIFIFCLSHAYDTPMYAQVTFFLPDFCLHMSIYFNNRKGIEQTTKRITTKCRCFPMDAGSLSSGRSCRLEMYARCWITSSFRQTSCCWLPGESYSRSCNVLLYNSILRIFIINFQRSSRLPDKSIKSDCDWELKKNTHPHQFTCYLVHLFNQSQ